MIYICDDDHDQIAHSEDRPRSSYGDYPLCKMRGEMRDRIDELESDLYDARIKIEGLEHDLRDARVEIETLTAKLES